MSGQHEVYFQERPRFFLLAMGIALLTIILLLLAIPQLILGILLEQVFVENTTLLTILKYAMVATVLMSVICMAIGVPMLLILRCPACNHRLGSLTSEGHPEFRIAHGQSMRSFLRNRRYICRFCGALVEVQRSQTHPRPI